MTLDFHKMKTKLIGIDAQCVSYLIDAMQNVKEPNDSLAPEKVSLFRTYLYTPGTLCVTPTVTQECAAIRNIALKKLHDSYIAVLLGESQITDPVNVESRVMELELYHNEKKDCRILAEAEDAEFYALLSYDNNFLNRLKKIPSSVKLYRPTEFWTQLNISQGAKPDKVPHVSSPLAQQSWWKW